MPVNANKPHRWKADTARSIDFYNDWFLHFAPLAFRDARGDAIEEVVSAMNSTDNFTKIWVSRLRKNPSILPILRMATAPPLARDRLVGLAGVSSSLVKNMELEQRISPRMNKKQVTEELKKMCGIIKRLLDTEIFSWVEKTTTPTSEDIYRAATVIADRRCSAVADPIIRNAQERRQLSSIQSWLEDRGYILLESPEGTNDRKPGTFSFRLNVQVELSPAKVVNIPVDAVVCPHDAKPEDFPLLIEAKSAGDFTNTNKRRKEEAAKFSQLKSTYGDNVRFLLFLCGFFDSGYLGYEAAEGIDWVWEHRIDDLAEFGL